MNRPLALSTCWNSHRHTDGLAMLQEITDLGFEAVELSHGVRLPLIDGAIQGVRQKLIRVTSVHNFCPLPAAAMGAAPNFYQPTSDYKSERAAWVGQTLRTLQFCNEVGCDRLVLHLGRVSFWFRSPWNKFEQAKEKLSETGKTLTESDLDHLDHLRKSAAEKLWKKQNALNSRLRECFDLVAPKAKELGVKMASENREDPHEVPVDLHFQEFWDTLQKDYEIGYWHDTGHARIKEIDGLISIPKWLEGVVPHLLGWHFHDVSGEGKDHQIPGRGSVDFSALGPLIRPEHSLTLELHPSASRQDIQVGREYLCSQLKI